MKRKLIYLGLLMVLVAMAMFFLFQRRQQTAEAKEVSAGGGGPQALLDAANRQQMVSAPGRVEPISEEIEVGAEVSGKIRSVFVEEGSQVQRGQTLAVLENSDYQAQLASAEARVRQSEAELRRIVNGARTEERNEARAAVEQAEAVAKNARLEVARRQTLVRDGDIPREEYDRAARDASVAEARVRELKERFANINAAAREEDVARAEALLALAHAAVKEAQARLAKTIIHSPITGIVLRKRKRAGESISPEMTNAALFTIADTHTLRVRADVDETDVARVHTGQRAYMKADAYGEQQFWGRVVRVGQVLGHKNIRTEEPVERVDTKILETLVELDRGQTLPPGLRVDTFILVEK